MSNEDNQRTPVSEIDLTFLTTSPSWGKNEVPTAYMEQIIKDKQVILAQIDADGNIQIVTDENNRPITYNNIQKIWSRLGFLTKDVRLGNISKLTGEADYCTYYLDLAGDLLEAGYPNAHITALQRVAVKLEVSQSIGGFLRKRQGTITQENITNELDPKKKSFFGGEKHEG